MMNKRIWHIFSVISVSQFYFNKSTFLTISVNGVCYNTYNQMNEFLRITLLILLNILKIAKLVLDICDDLLADQILQLLIDVCLTTRVNSNKIRLRICFSNIHVSQVSLHLLQLYFSQKHSIQSRLKEIKSHLRTFLLQFFHVSVPSTLALFILMKRSFSSSDSLS